MEVAESQKILLPGDLIGNYRIDNFLGQGGFGITYLAHDTMLDIKVAIKEYLPERIARRVSQHTVSPRKPEDSDVFRKGLDNFLKEARTLARFDHPNIVSVRSVFELGGTAYMVMDYEPGCNLKYLFDKRKLNTEAALKSIVGPLLDGLSEVHRCGFIHRDIKPANIIMRYNSSPVLLDFGSARLATGQYTADITAMVTAGFAPLEQYSGIVEQQGPWSDIYALGAVLYYAITGKAPEDSTARGSALVNGQPDPLKALSELAPKGYSRSFCKAIDWALAFKVSARPQTLAQWRCALLNSQLNKSTEVLRDPVDLNRYRQMSSSVNRHQTYADTTIQTTVPGTEFADDLTVIAPETSVSGGSTRSSIGNTLISSRRHKGGWRKASAFLSQINYRLVAVLGMLVGLAWLTSFLIIQREDLPPPELANQAETPTIINDNIALADAPVETDTAVEGSPPLDDIVDTASVDNVTSASSVEGGESATVAGENNSSVQKPESEKSKVEQSGLAAEQEASREAERQAQLASQQQAEQQRQAQLRRESAEAQAREAEQQQQLQRPELPNAEKLESELFDAELASERNAIKPTITDTDMFIVLTRFNSLTSAIRDRSGEEIRELTILSERNNRFFDYVFRTFDKVDASISNITASRWDQTIRATLSINRMTRGNGDVAYAPEEFKNIPIFSVRDDTWSAIHW